MCGTNNHKYIVGMPWEPTYDILQYLTFEEAQMVVDKGQIVFRLKSGMEVKVKANTLGDGIKRLVSFFKDLKKQFLEDEDYYMQRAAGLLQKLLEKHEINLEAI